MRHFVKVYEAFNGLALSSMIFETTPVRQPMIAREPIVQKEPAGIARALVMVGAPCAHGLADRWHTWRRSYSGLKEVEFVDFGSPPAWHAFTAPPPSPSLSCRCPEYQ